MFLENKGWLSLFSKYIEEYAKYFYYKTGNPTEVWSVAVLRSLRILCILVPRATILLTSGRDRSQVRDLWGILWGREWSLATPRRSSRKTSPVSTVKSHGQFPNLMPRLSLSTSFEVFWRDNDSKVAQFFFLLWLFMLLFLSMFPWSQSILKLNLPFYEMCSMSNLQQTDVIWNPLTFCGS